MNLSFRVFSLLQLLCGLLVHEVCAQREYYNWYFEAGPRENGITFNTLPASALPTGAVPFSTTEQFYISTMSDSVGAILFTTNGWQIWNRNRQLMPNGSLIIPLPLSIYRWGIATTSIKLPGRAHRYLLILEAPNTDSLNLCGTLFYNLVDMQLAGGLGDVVGGAAELRLPAALPRWYINYCMRSNPEIIRHANGRDMWLVLRYTAYDPNGRRNDFYLSYLITEAGIAPVPVSSPAVAKASYFYSRRSLKATPNGRVLALADVNDGTIDIDRFDAASGYILPEYRINNAYRTQSVAFSPDGSKLYVDSLNSRTIWQYDLSERTPALVAKSRRVAATLHCSSIGRVGGLELGPDGCVYSPITGVAHLARFRFPNAVGRASRFEERAIPLKKEYYGGIYPINLPNDLNMSPVQLQSGQGGISSVLLPDSAGCEPASVSIPGGSQTVTTCIDKLTYFYADASAFLAAENYRWDFGDPAAGAANYGSGQAPAHRYRLPGTYTIRLRLLAPDGRQFDSQQIVQVEACTSVLPNIITPNGDGANDAFVLNGLESENWSLKIFDRWGRCIFQSAAYDNTWNAKGKADGVYFYQAVHKLTNQQLRGTLTVVR